MSSLGDGGDDGYGRLGRGQTRSNIGLSDSTERRERKEKKKKKKMDSTGLSKIDE